MFRAFVTPRNAMIAVAALGVGTVTSKQVMGTNSMSTSRLLGIRSAFAAPPKAFSPEEFREFEFVSKTPVTHDTNRYRFKLPSEDHIMGMPVASCIVTRAPPPPGEEKPVIRPYTPVTTDVVSGHFDLVVKVYPDGKMGNHINNLKKGDKLAVKGPFVKFEYKPNMHKQIYMLAGGSGITPMYQVLQEIARDPNDATEVTLVFANRTEDDIILGPELDEISRNNENINIRFVVTKPKNKEKISPGYINESLLREILPDPKEPGVKVLVCGTPGFYKAISGPKNPDKSQGELSGILKKMGFSKDQVFKF